MIDFNDVAMVDATAPAGRAGTVDRYRNDPVSFASGGGLWDPDDKAAFLEFADREFRRFSDSMFMRYYLATLRRPGSTGIIFNLTSE